MEETNKKQIVYIPSDGLLAVAAGSGSSMIGAQFGLPVGGEIGGPAGPATSLGPDENFVARMLGPVITFFAVAVSLAILRLYSRVTRPQGIDLRFTFSWDDINLLLALIFTILQFSFLMAAVPHGVGRHNSYVPYKEQVEANKLLLISQLPWGWAVAFAKISIACLLLRLKNATSEGLWPWKVPLYFLIVVQIASAVAANVVQLTQCRPIIAIWDPTTPEAVCRSPSVAHTTIYVTSAFAIMSDIFLATAPVSFLKIVRRSIRERAILIFLMGLASFTAIATIIKLPMVGPYGQYGDGLSNTIGIMTWSSIEAYMGIIAASVPCLKSPFESFLRRVGVLKSTASNGSDHGSGADASRERYIHSDVMGNLRFYGNSSFHHAQDNPHGHGHGYGHGHDREHTHNHSHKHKHTRTQSCTQKNRKSYRLSRLSLPAIPISGGHFLSPKSTPDVVLNMAQDAVSSEQSILDHSNSSASRKEEV